MDIYGTHRTAQEKELKSATVAAAVDTVDYHIQNLRMNNSRRRHTVTLLSVAHS